MTKYNDDEDYVMVRLKTGKFKRYNWTRGQGVWVSKINTEEERQILALLLKPGILMRDIDRAMKEADEYYRKTGRERLVTPATILVNLSNPEISVGTVHQAFSQTLGPNRVRPSKRWRSAA